MLRSFGASHCPNELCPALPAASWQAVMGGLADHFGDNAELAELLTGDPALAGVTDLYHEVARRLPELNGAHVRKGDG